MLTAAAELIKGEMSRYSERCTCSDLESPCPACGIAEKLNDIWHRLNKIESTKLLAMEVIDSESGLMQCQVCGEKRTFERFIEDLKEKASPEVDIDPETIKKSLPSRSSLSYIRKTAGGSFETLAGDIVIGADAWHCPHGCEIDLAGLEE